MRKPILHIAHTAFGAPTDEIPPPRQQYKIQRRGARVRVRAGTPAKLHFWDVTLRNISRSGILLEHHHRVRVGELYRLSFQVDGLHLKVMARAVRSFVSHFITVAGGEQQIVYHTGMEFTALTDDTVALVSAYIDHLRAADLAP